MSPSDPPYSSTPELTPKEERASRDRVLQIARWMDEDFRIPGTGIRFGWDNLLGLIPGIGDALSTLIGLAIVEEARRIGVPASIRFRMVVNLLLDLIIGTIPFGGDVLDLFLKANRANAKLYLEFYEDPQKALRRTQQGNRALLLGATLLTLAVAVSLAAFFFWLGHRTGGE